MKIIVDEKAKPFSFSVEAKVLDSCVAKVMSVVTYSGGTTDKDYLISSNGTELFVIGQSTDSFAACVVPDAAVKGAGSFGFDTSLLSGILKSRAGLDFEFNGSKCLFKVTKGKYSGDIVTSPLTADTLSRIREKVAAKTASAIALDPDLMKFVDEGLACTNVKDIYTGGVLLSYMMLGPKGLTIFSFDQHHFAYYRALKIKSSEAQIAAPSTVFSLISKIFGSDKTKISVTKDSIRISSSFFLMSVPTVQVDQKDFTLVPDYIRAIKEFDFSCSFSNEKMLALMDNLITVHSASSLLELIGKPDTASVGISLTSQNGSVSDSIKVTTATGKAVKVKADPRLVKDSFSLLKPGEEDPTLGVVDGRMIVAKSKMKSGASLTIVNSIAG